MSSLGGTHKALKPPPGGQVSRLVLLCLVLFSPFLAAGRLTAKSLVQEQVQEQEQANTVEAAPLFKKAFKHIEPHQIGELFGLPVYNSQVAQLVALFLMLLIFLNLRAALAKEAAGGSMGRFSRIFSGFVLFIRDEMVHPVLGDEDTKRFLPYFLFVFFFIVIQNLLGLIPGPPGIVEYGFVGVTATSSIFVTGALALTTFAFMLGSGMKAQGVVAFWKNLVPPGVPPWLVPLMFLVEIIGLLVKPFALMIRLFANMLAGHLVLISFITLIVLFGKMMGNMAWFVAPAPIGLSVFIMIIEGFIALLQAYIFTYLSILFVGMCRHPEH